jgi:hypothetical protein
MRNAEFAARNKPAACHLPLCNFAHFGDYVMKKAVKWNGIILFGLVVILLVGAP